MFSCPFVLAFYVSFTLGTILFIYAASSFSMNCPLLVVVAAVFVALRVCLFNRARELSNIWCVV